MTLVQALDVYDALPIPSDALDRGGVEMLRAGVVDEELFVTARRAFTDPAHWGYLLADVTRRLATLYAAEGAFTEGKVSAAIAAAFAQALRDNDATAAKPQARKAKAVSSRRPAGKSKPKSKPESALKAAARKRARTKS